MTQINITTAQGFTNDELKKANEARLLLNKILNSDKFRESILRFSTDGLYRFHYRRSLWGKWIDKPYTNQQVYEAITRQPFNRQNLKQQIDINLRMLPGGKGKFMGYTNNTTQSEILTYRNWLKSLTLADYAGHLSHELCHMLGFGHANIPTIKIQNSVPFGVVNIIEKLGSDY